MSEVIDGADASFTVDGVEVGGINKYRFFEGRPTTIQHKPIGAKAAEYLPAVPDYGTATLEILRDHTDHGQQLLSHSQATRKMLLCAINLADGTTLNFKAFCESMPLIGGKRNGETINTSQCRLRISGPVTPM